MENQYTLKVYPVGRGTSVYRVIEISGKSTLQKLCDTILSAFDFDGGHMFEYCMDNKMYGANTRENHPSIKKKLDQLGLQKGQKFSLHYDFGDDWMFTINVQKITEIAEATKPCVVKEKGHVEQYPDWDEEDWDE